MIARLRVKNGAQELVVSSEGRLPYCVGKAVLQGPVVQPSGTARTSAPGRVAGYSIYRVSHSGPILAAFDMPVGYTIGVLGITSPASGVYDIKIYCGANPDALGFDTQYPLDVWAFGFADTRSAPFGLVLRTEAGVLAADFTRSTPLFPRGVGDTVATPNGFSIPSLSRPVGLGMPYYRRVDENPRPGSGFVTDHYSRKMLWLRTSTTAVTTRTVILQQYVQNTEDPIHDEDSGPGTLFTIEGGTLP